MNSTRLTSGLVTDVADDVFGPVDVLKNLFRFSYELRCPLREECEGRIGKLVVVNVIIHSDRDSTRVPRNDLEAVQKILIGKPSVETLYEADMS